MINKTVSEQLSESYREALKIANEWLEKSWMETQPDVKQTSADAERRLSASGYNIAATSKAEVEASRARAKAGNKGIDKPVEYPSERLPKGAKPINRKALMRAAKSGRLWEELCEA